MNKIIVITTLAASITAYALPTYEPFTEFGNNVALNGSNMYVVSNGINLTSIYANGLVSNCLDLATGGFTAPGGESWTSLNFSGSVGQNTKPAGFEFAMNGLDVALINNSNIFAVSNISSLLPATFPGFPTGLGGIPTIVENPAQPLIATNYANAPTNFYEVNQIVGNSAVLRFANGVTRPAAGFKTVFVSYLLSVQQQGQLGSGNDGRYFEFLPSTNLVEGPGTGGVYTNWNQMFNTFNTTTADKIAGHGLLAISGSSAYIGACDNSAGKDFSSSAFTLPLGSSYPGNSGAPVFVVGAYLFNASGKDTNVIWVNPAINSFGGALPPASPIQAVTMAYNISDIGGIVFEDRVGNGASGGVGTNYVGNLLIGSTWSYVTGGPEFTNQPVANVSTNYGSTVSLSAAATAAGQTVSYQWQKVTAGTTNTVSAGAGGAGGNAFVTIATNAANVATITLAGLSAGDFGSYQAVATSSGTGYSLASSTANITADPNITSQPQNAVAAIGGAATFSIAASTQFGSLSYQWELNGAPLSNGTQLDGSVISGAASANLTIANAQFDESALPITVAVSNGVPDGEISGAATLTLSDPAITSNPASVTTNYGATVTFTSTAQTTVGHAPLKYAWYNGSTQLANGLQADGSTVTGVTGTSAGSALSATLTIANVSDQDSGNYSLSVTNAINGSVNSSAAALFVNDPVIIAQPPATVEVVLGGNASIPIVAVGSSLSYQWNGSSLPGDYSGTTTSNLILNGAQATDAGTFNVTVSGLTNTLTSSTVNVYVETAPTGVTVSPPTLTQQSGTHLALLGAVTGGSGLVHTIWQLNGTNLTDGQNVDSSSVLGSATPTLVLSNLQTTDSGTYTLIVSNAAGYVSASSVVTVTGKYLALSSANLVVTRVGEGSQTLSGATGNTLYLDQFTTNGSYVSTIMVPDSGPNAIIVAGAAVPTGNEGAQEAYLTLSSNQEYLNFGGFYYSYPYTAGSDVTVGGAGNVRGIYALNASGVLALVYTNYGLYSGGHGFRDVYSTDGLTNFWTTGSASGGTVKYVNAGPAGAAYTITTPGQGIPALSAANTGGVALGLAGTNLVFTDNETLETAIVVPSVFGIDEFTGAPEAGTTATTQILGGGEAHGDDFAFSSDLQTVYVADDDYSTSYSGSTFGGIQRYDLVGGVYTYQYNLSDTTGTGTNGARGLVVYWPPDITTWGQGVEGAVLYATTSETSSNRIIQIIDNNGANSVSTALATSGANQFYRGIRFGPITAPLAITGEPQSQSALVGQSVELSAEFSGTMSYYFPNSAGTGYNPVNATPIYYQWFTNGSAIPGATNAAYYIPNVQLGNAASYTIVASNGLTAVTSSPPAVLTVSPFSPNSELAGWFRFNDGSGTNAADSSIYGNTGALFNLPGDNSEWVAGLGGSDALNFANVDSDGDNVVVIPDAPQLNFSNNLVFTLAAWINSANTNQASGAAIIDKGYGAGGEQYTLDIYTNAYRFYVRNAAGAAVLLYGSNVPPGNQWQHVAATFDGNRGILALYVNGQLVASNTSAPNSLLPTSYPVSIGNRQSSATNAYDLPFLGEIQDVRIYNAALGAPDIAAVYQTLAPPTQPSQFVTSLPPAFVAAGQLRLNLGGAPNTSFRLWVTTNIALTPITTKWTLLTNSAFDGSGAATVIDATATNASKYYAITQP
jgi:hypothetical protein